jgi:hypothetical protein
MNKMHGKDLFYSCVSRKSNVGLRKEGGREVMARLSAATK